MSHIIADGNTIVINNLTANSPFVIYAKNGGKVQIETLNLSKQSSGILTSDGKGEIDIQKLHSPNPDFMVQRKETNGGHVYIMENMSGEKAIQTENELELYKKKLEISEQ